MRAVVQRVTQASVTVGGVEVSRIGAGLAVLLGIGRSDGEADAVFLAEKCAHLRIFDDEQGVMNRSLLDIGGSLLLVSQFTLYADARRGRRPSYQAAAPADDAALLFARSVEIFAEKCRRVETGVFQADMQLALINNGPVTILLDSRKEF